MTAWAVGSFHGFALKTHLLGETSPNKSPRLISHFSSYLVIDLFLCKPENLWILILFQYNKYFYYFNITQRGPGGALRMLRHIVLKYYIVNYSATTSFGNNHVGDVAILSPDTVFYDGLRWFLAVFGHFGTFTCPKLWGRAFFAGVFEQRSIDNNKMWDSGRGQFPKS